MELPSDRAGASPSSALTSMPHGQPQTSLQQPRVASSLPAIAVALRTKHELHGLPLFQYCP